MEEFKGTKGEWKLLGESHDNYISVGTSALQVCRVNWGKEGTEYDFKNAKLIAAAPDLLEALKEMARMYEKVLPAGGYQGVYEMSKDAIKKALE